MKKTEITREEFEALEREYNQARQRQEEEEKRIQEVNRREGLRLAREAEENDKLRVARGALQYIENQVGDLIHDPDFLWLMICVIFYTTDEGRVRPEGNRLFQNVISAYMRNRKSGAL